MAYEVPGFVYSEKAADAAIIQFHAVKLTANGLVACPATEQCDGIAQQPAAAAAGAATDNETIRVMKSGISFAIAGAAGVTRGSAVVVGAAAGVLMDDGGGAVIVGKALQTAVAGEVFSVLLY